jgi:hypothetical protein
MVEAIKIFLIVRQGTDESEESGDSNEEEDE